MNQSGREFLQGLGILRWLLHGKGRATSLLFFHVKFLDGDKAKLLDWVVLRMAGAFCLKVELSLNKPKKFECIEPT